MKQRFSPTSSLIPCLCAPLLARADEAPASAIKPLPYDSLLNVIVGLCLVLALLFVATWVVRRFQGIQVGGDRSIELVSQLPLGVKEKVLLLRVGDENILVGCTSQQIRPLHSWQGPRPQAPTESGGGRKPFAEQMQQLLAKGKSS